MPAEEIVIAPVKNPSVGVVAPEQLMEHSVHVPLAVTEGRQKNDGIILSPLLPQRGDLGFVAAGERAVPLLWSPWCGVDTHFAPRCCGTRHKALTWDISVNRGGRYSGCLRNSHCTRIPLIALELVEKLR